MNKKLNIEDFQGGDTERCSMCDEGEAVRTFEIQAFEYGTGENAVMLQARVPVWSCPACEFQYVDAEGERAQHDAVCRHFGRLTPAKIKLIRLAAGLTQKQFAEELACGVASLKRWESGALIQGRAFDVAIREFQAGTKRRNPPKPKFRTPISDEQRAAAKKFQLRAFCSDALAA